MTDYNINIHPTNASRFNDTDGDGLGKFEGWGTSLCWWANRLGYNKNLINQAVDKFYSENGLNLNIGRYNVGGGDCVKDTFDTPYYIDSTNRKIVYDLYTSGLKPEYFGSNMSICSTWDLNNSTYARNDSDFGITQGSTIGKIDAIPYIPMLDKSDEFGTTLTYSNINVTETGRYTVKFLLTLAGINDRDFAIRVNGVSKYVISSNDINNNVIGYGNNRNLYLVTFNGVNLIQGKNTIEVGGNTTWTLDVVKMAVVRSNDDSYYKPWLDTPMNKKADVYDFLGHRYPSYYGQHQNTFDIDMNTTYMIDDPNFGIEQGIAVEKLKGLGWNPPMDEYSDLGSNITYNIDVKESGSYSIQLMLHLEGINDRDIAIKVNGLRHVADVDYVNSNIIADNGERKLYIVRFYEIDLAKGNNTIVIGGATGWTLDLVKLLVVKTSSYGVLPRDNEFLHEAHINRSDSKVPGYCVDVTKIDTSVHSIDWYNKYYERVDEECGYAWNYDWNADRYQMNITKAIAKEKGNEFITEAFSNSPPYFMTVSGCSSGHTDSNQTNLRDNSYNAFAKYMADVIAHFNSENDGVTFTSATGMNEPNTNYWGAYSNKQEGCHIAPGESQSKVITSLNWHLRDKGVTNCIISGTDETSIDTAIDSYNSLTSDAKNTISRIDTHTYSGSKREELRQLAESGGKNLWMSEVDGDFTAGDNAGEMSSALGLANHIITDLNWLRPSAWILWDIVDMHCDTGNTHDGDDFSWLNTNGGYWGLTACNHDDEYIWLLKKYYAFGQFTRYIRPGHILIPTSDYAIASYDPEGHKLTIVVTNTWATDRECQFSLGNANMVDTEYIKAIRTSGSLDGGENWADVSSSCSISIDKQNKSFTTTLKANSITTYIVNDIVLPNVEFSMKLNNIDNIRIRQNVPYNIAYNTNKEVVKHEISWDGGNTYWDKTNEVTSTGTLSYNYQCRQDSDYGTFDMAVRVTDENGNRDVKTFRVILDTEDDTPLTTQVVIYKGINELTPVSTTPTTNQYQAQITSTINCSAILESDNKTIRITDITGSKGQINVHINVENVKSYDKVISVAKVTAGYVIRETLVKQSKLEQTLDGFKQSVSENYATGISVKNIISKLSTMEQTVNGFKHTVKEEITANDENIRNVSSKLSIIEQTANKINWLVKNGSSESNMILTDILYQVLAENIKLSAKNIALEGYITANQAFEIAEDGTVQGTDITLSNVMTAKILNGEQLFVPWYDTCLTGNVSVYINSNYDYSDVVDDEYFYDGAKFSSFGDMKGYCPRNLNGYRIDIYLESDITENVYINNFNNGICRIHFHGHTIKGYLFAYGRSLDFAVYGNDAWNTNGGTTGKIMPGASGRKQSDYRFALGADRCRIVVYDIDLYAGTSTDVSTKGMLLTNGANAYISNLKGVNTLHSLIRAQTASHGYVASSSGLTESTTFQAVSGAQLHLGNGDQAGRNGSSTYWYESGNGKVWRDGATTTTSGNSGTNGNTGNVQTTTVTKIIKSDTGYSWRTNGSYANSWSSDAVVRQGRWSSSLGQNVGYWFFGWDIYNILRDSNNVIESVKIKITRQSGGNNASVRHYLRAHTYTSKPSSPSLQGTSVLNKSFDLAVGNSITLSLTASEISALKSNNSKGFGLYTSVTTTGASGSYSCCSASCTVTIKYKTVDVSSGGEETTNITMNGSTTMTVTKGQPFSIPYSTNVEPTRHEMSWDGGTTFYEMHPSTYNQNNYTYIHEAITDTTWNPVSRTIRVTGENGSTATLTITITIDDSGSSTVDTNSLVLNMQYATSHQSTPNCPDGTDWKTAPRLSKGATLPTQNCNCSSCASNSKYDGGLWKSFGQWVTVYKEAGKSLVENVGVELTDFKMWRYNTSTNKWVLVSEGFDYGAFYLEDFWDDGNAPLPSNKVLSSDKKTYKCLMNSSTSGRCFHPFSPQINWSDVGFSDSNPCYVVSQVKFRLIKWSDSGADNRANADLGVNVGGDYWIYKGAGFDGQWRHNSDFAVGYFAKATNDWQYVYATSCPQDWDKGFPIDTI